MSEIKCPKCGDMIKIDETGYNAIVKQVKDKEFEKELKKIEDRIKKTNEAELKSLKLEEASKSEKEINKIKSQLEKAKMEKDMLKQAKDAALEVEKAIFQKELEKINSKLSKVEQDKQLLVAETASKAQEILAKKEKEIAELKLENKSVQSAKELELQLLEKAHLEEIAKKDDQIGYYKDLKMKQSTKMLGETLEQHCETAFNQVRHVGFQSAYFEKDNDAKTGSKGDYIFKDFTPNGNELISIMFEMKNEDDRTATKKKNEDFLKELDKDRREKGCEYAVLVSLLEQDNDYYNTGIVDVSHKYPKMFVIRPQFFIQIITLLRNAAQNAAQYKDQLVEVKNQNIDISNFENEIELFKSTFGRSVKYAGDRFNDTIKYIDDTINSLQKAREELRKSVKHLNIADGKANDLTIQKLTKDNPTMIAKFKELD